MLFPSDQLISSTTIPHLGHFTRRGRQVRTTGAPHRGTCLQVLSGRASYPGLLFPQPEQIGRDFISSTVNPQARTDFLLWPGIPVPAVRFSCPFLLLVFSAALKSIDGNPYEAARIDGAGP